MPSDEESSRSGIAEDDTSGLVIEEADEDTIRIMVSTDNHLGYLEGDAVRGNDSFAAMEEVLYLAKHYGCDMVLLAGDLFHDNKPSRRTMHKTMTMFRKYCMGPNPISIQIISDQSKNFRQGQVNYQNEFYSVDLPVMSIHGNHDDPSREGTELYAALDLLDCANLVNYFGRQDEINQIQISPILIKKGDTHLALYGLGSMRDERLNRMWQSSKVTFLRPAQDTDDAPEFFNLFALHQNRDKGRGSKNCVHETMIPEWMDLVCWGHEHECCIEPQESVVGTFRISQPGSSVATSLVAGEAVQKQVGILDIRGQAFRLRPIPLTQVRTFVIGEISLQQHRSLDPDDPKVEQKVKQILKEEVDLLMYQAKEKRNEFKRKAQENANVIAQAKEHPLTNKLEKPDEVLVRLKVEHSGFAVLNNQRFGAQFIGQVANPTDILLFQRKKVPPTKSSSKNKKMEPIVPELLEQLNIEDFIIGELEQSDRKLEVLDEKRIALALDDYVQKQEAQALPETINSLLAKQQKKLIQRDSTIGQDAGDKPAEPQTQSEDEHETSKAFTEDEPHHNGSQADSDVEDMEILEISPVASSKSRPKAQPKRATKSRSQAKSSRSHNDSDLDSDEHDSEKGKSLPTKSRSTRRKLVVNEDDSGEESKKVSLPKKAPANPRPGRAGNAGKKKMNYYEGNDSLDESVEDEVDEDDPPPRGKRTRSKNSANTSISSKSGSRLSQSQLSFVPVKHNGKSSSRKRGRLDMHSDEEHHPINTTSTSYDLDEDWGTAKTDTFDA